MRIRLDMGNELIHFPLLGTNSVVSEAEGFALSSWTEFATLEEQANRIVEAAPYLDFAGAMTMLEKFRNAGFLAPLSDLLGDPAPALEKRNRSVEFVTIPTCERPEALATSIGSFSRNALAHGKTCRFLVSDDSKSPTTRAACRVSMKTLAENAGAAISYFGAEEKRAWADALASTATDVPRDVIDYALFGNSSHARTAGANRNAILLYTAGTMLLSVDDDSVCIPGAVSDTGVPTSLRMEGHGNPNEMWFFDQRQTAYSFVSPVDVDVLAEHEKLLGLTVSEVVTAARRSGTEVDFNHMCAHLMASAVTGVGTVRTTLNGIAGDSGLYSDLSILTNSGDGTRERLREYLGSSEKFRSTREIVSQALRPTVSHGQPLCPSGICGLDNRDLLPPFVPGFLNEDGTFAHLLSRLDEEAYVGYLPFTLRHAASAGRTYAGDSCSTVRFSDLLAGLTDTWQPSITARTTTARLKSLGQHFEELGRLQPFEFAELTQVILASRLSQLIQMHERALMKDTYRPECLADELESRISRMRSSIESPQYFVPSDIREYEPEMPGLAAQKEVARFGVLVSWWPAIMDAALRLKQEGREFAKLYTPVDNHKVVAA